MSGNRFSFDLHAFCALALVRRFYQSLVVALAVFILTLVALREPFRGYLAEVRISGPVSEGLDLNAAATWLKQADREVAVVTSRGRDSSGRGQIRATYVAPRASIATRRLDGLAERWLYQYLPNRLTAHRHTVLAQLRGAVQIASDREAEVRSRLEVARQIQLAQALKEGLALGIRAGAGENVTTTPGENSVNAEPPASHAPLSEGGANVAEVPSRSESEFIALEKLNKLRFELAELLSNFTEQHPQVITLKAQIASLEGEIAGMTSAGGAAELPWNSGRGTGGRSLQKTPNQLREINFETTQTPVRAAQHFTSTNAATAGSEVLTSNQVDVEMLHSTLAAATRERQAAEIRLTERMQMLSNQAAAAHWTAAPAGVVTRLGGTPRLSTIAVASMLAGMIGLVVFRASGYEPASARISSTAELATVMELPIVGNLSSLRAAGSRIRRRLLTAGRLKFAMHLGEVLIALAVAACVISIVLEPSLAKQVLADPFGTLSEVIGRSTKY